MATDRKQKYTDLDEAGKLKVRKASLMSLVITVIVCSVIVGCFACKQENTPDPKTVMTDKQKAAYWTASIADLRWFPQTDENP